MSLSTSAQPPTSSVQHLSTGPATIIDTIVVPGLANLADAYPESINRPGRGEDYLCQLCHFSHKNLDSILTHVRRHIDITVGCPVSGKGYQNVASLQKHSSNAHNIQIVAPATPLQSPYDPKEEI